MKEFLSLTLRLMAVAIVAGFTWATVPDGAVVAECPNECPEAFDNNDVHTVPGMEFTAGCSASQACQEGTPGFTGGNINCSYMWKWPNHWAACSTELTEAPLHCCMNWTYYKEYRKQKCKIELPACTYECTGWEESTPVDDPGGQPVPYFLGKCVNCAESENCTSD